MTLASFLRSLCSNSHHREHNLSTWCDKCIFYTNIYIKKAAHGTNSRTAWLFKGERDVLAITKEALNLQILTVFLLSSPVTHCLKKYMALVAQILQQGGAKLHCEDVAYCKMTKV